MGRRTVKNTAGSESGKRHSQPIARDYVEEIQQRAEQLAQPYESTGNTGREAASAKHRGQRLEPERAGMRSETAEASHLAEDIENLSNRTVQPKRNRIMTETSVAKQTQARQHRRREENAVKAGAGKLSFNPLHPSMELPPEQLIRLLGLETKKTRKHQRARQAGVAQSRTQTVTEARPATETKPVTETSPVTETKPVTKVQPDVQAPAPRPAPATASRTARREQAIPAVFESKRGGLLVPATAIGVVAGALVSAFLFWPGDESAPITATETTAPPAQHIERAAVAKKVAKQPVPAPMPDQAELRTAIQAEQQRLRNEAEQRLSERLNQRQAGQETLAAPPVFSYEAAEAALAPAVTDDSLLPNSEELFEAQPPQPLAQEPGERPGVDPAAQNAEETTLTPEAQASGAHEVGHAVGLIGSAPAGADSSTAEEVQPVPDDAEFAEPVPAMESELTAEPLRGESVDGESLLTEEPLSTLDSNTEPQEEYGESGKESFAGPQATTGSDVTDETLTGEPADAEPFASQGAMDAEVTDEPLTGEPVEAEPIAAEEPLSTLESSTEPEVENIETGKPGLTAEQEVTYSSP